MRYLICAIATVVFVSVASAQVTPAQREAIMRCYLSDAGARGQTNEGIIQELLTFIFLSRTAQRTQVTNVMQRCRDRLTEQQANFDAQSAAGRAGLDADATTTTDALGAVPNLP